MIVSKFGGTSMGNAECMRRSAEVSLKQRSNIIVVSATSGTTNLLIEVAQTAEKNSWEQTEIVLNKIKTSHLKIATDLELTPEAMQKITYLFTELESLSKGIYLLKDCSAKAFDYLQSFGERLSSILFTEALIQTAKKNSLSKDIRWLDARSIIKTDDQFNKAKPLTEKIIRLATDNLMPLLKNSTLFVTQGFIGETLEGNTTTLGRGGSDYSAAIFAEAISAEVLEIWTDVPGIATTDPRIVPEAKSLKEISFKEASELATFGAKVLHPATLIPAIRKNIPVFVGSSFDADQNGTWVLKEVSEWPLVRAMALRKKQVLVTVSTPEMLHSHGFLFRIFKIFNDHKVSIDAITTSEISVSLTLDDSTLLNTKLIQDLADIAEVQIEEGLALVSLIGNNINHTPGFAKQIFETIADINVRMICLGASKHNFCFLVKEDIGATVIQKLHAHFIS
ncbi:MAG: lysine-sensitive aspartokinase 3 [Pseudobdellovibrio sp.]